MRTDKPRFIVREAKVGKAVRYMVYDRQTASYPVLRPGLTLRPFYTDQAEAQGQADALNKAEE